MILALIAVAYTFTAVGLGVVLGKAMALTDRDQPLTYDERQALIQRSRRRHPAGQHIGPPQEWLL